MVLRKGGFEPVEVKDGNEAMEVLTGEDPPGIALLDYNMPGLYGVDVVKRLRERENGPACYVILLSGSQSGNTRGEALEAGADQYVSKPFDKEVLLEMLREGARRVGGG